MNIKIHRIYDDDVPQGYRALVDRLWPRGISKEAAHLDGHWKDLAPSNGLRIWFGHDPGKWNEFRKRYLDELRTNKHRAQEHLKEVDRQNLVLLYGAKDRKHNHAHVLKDFLAKLTS
ncbi:DUF488 domain-containing protein [Desulfoplanes formicivorans]|uniref:Uroporphyrin-III C-methyltransferase n=1 Tax=Desulfoplanes formicivorans TaxID=1592317 RepID=A0A194AF20_9BACT|nr:DUF488 family protein [Desulfoplanes formicivorans]GAU07379.1 uroporphyrin-III C-methyltransferase [Desulfoplanes formicivorans]